MKHHRVILFCDGDDNLRDIAWLGSCIVQWIDDINMASLLAVTATRSLTGLGRDDINMASVLAVTATRSLTDLGRDDINMAALLAVTAIRSFIDWSG